VAARTGGTATPGVGFAPSAGVSVSGPSNSAEAGKRADDAPTRASRAGPAAVISIKELHGPDAWKYLMESVTDGQGDLREASAITRYYTDAGTPPGRWTGTGLAGLAGGAGLKAGSKVSGEQMEMLFGEGRDPVTGEKLGRGFRHPPSYTDRVAARVNALPKRITGEARAKAIEKIRVEERARRMRRPVVGFDYVFTVPKSVSALWAVSDQGTREQITAAHHDAVTDIVGLIERDVARTRIGTDGVAQVPVRGIVAAAFDHYDTRANDPNLHTHVVVANRVQAADGKWRTLDSRGVIFPSGVALSETYDNLIADNLTLRLGVGWDVREQGRKLKNARWEITGVPDELIDEFSQRSSEIGKTKDELVAKYRERTGREPDDATVLRLRQQATLDTRREKTHLPLATLADSWRARAATVLRLDDPSSLLSRVVNRVPRGRRLSADDFAGPRFEAVVDEVLARLHETRSTWTRWNIHAEAARATMKYRLSNATDRDALHQQLVEAVQARSVLLSAPPPASTPAAFRRPDGTSQFTPVYGAVYTSRTLLDAEARLLDAARTLAGPRVDADVVERVLTPAATDGHGVDEDQAAAVYAVTTSGRCLDVLVGPAGSGKTTTLAALREAWEAHYGTGSVVGLAPTAKAAEVLGDSLGIATENTAKWLTEHATNADRRQRLRELLDRSAAATAGGRPRDAARAAASAAALREQIRRWELHPGQLLVIDEASMSGTLALDRLTTQAQAAGAKVLLVGDWAQLSAVESGGAFRMLADDRADVPELSTVRRFSHEWERAASVRLRVGDRRAIDDYLTHQRVRGGAAEDMMAAAYAAWAADEHAGYRSLLIADTNAAVAELNIRARTDRVAWGLVEQEGVRLHDGTTAGVGDRIVTRQIDRTLRTSPHSWVKNGDQWTVVRRFDDGSLAVRRAIDPPDGKVLTLPAAYVAAHVELGYATTAHRAQGDTVDTAHTLVRPETTRELLYVGMTRARESNAAYVCADTTTDDDEHGPTGEDPTVRDVLEQVLARSGTELSAHETMRAEQERVGSIAQLAAEYDTIAREARRQRWTALAEASFPDLLPDDVARSESWPGLVAAWRRAEAAGLDLDTAARKLATNLPTGGDPVAVLRDRVQRWHDTAAPHHPPEQAFIAGLIPAARHISDPEMRKALDERATLIEQRAETLVAQAIESGESWIAKLGPRPDIPALRLRWERAAATVAAYRDRHGVTDPARPFGESTGGGQWTRRADRRRAQAAANQACGLVKSLRRTRHSASPEEVLQPTVRPGL
jgi:conjugative relaxase-like TrwC/TraI family protein